jgi:hypothetical protein
LLYNWLANKTTVKEHFAFMFNTEILADVHFKVILWDSLQLFSIIGNHSVFGVIHFEVIVQQQTVIKVGLLYNWLANMTTVKEHFVFMFNTEILADVHFKVILSSCCGSGIRCLFGPLDQGWVKNQDPDPGRTFRIIWVYAESLERNFWVKNVIKFFNADPDPGSF